MAIIYMGSFDDRVKKYPWVFPNGSPKATLKSYLNSIVQNTLIGHQSAINDGYLLNNPILRKSLFIDESSEFRNLFSTGQMIIPGRTDTFEELIEKQKEKGIKTFEDIPPKVVQNLKNVEAGLTHFNARMKGPESDAIWDGFFKLMASLQGRPFEELGITEVSVHPDDFKKALDTFLDLPHDGKPPSRTQWEQVLNSLSSKFADSGGFTAGHETKQVLMNLGNSAYHHNYARQLFLHSNKRVDVETANTRAFSHLLDSRKMELDIKKEEVPLIQIPPVNNLLKTGNIEKLIDPATPIGRHRDHFIKALDQFNDNPVREKLKNLKLAAEDYNTKIKEAFSDPKQEAEIAKSANFYLSLVGIGLGVAVPALSGIGALGTVSFGILSWQAVEDGTAVVTHLYTNGGQPYEIDYTKYLMASSKIKGT